MELIGRKIAGKYVALSEIGSGGMGTVYKARQIDLDKDIAIKVLRQSLATEPEFAGRFKREAKAASKIDHPNSMRVIDFGQEPDGLLYIAMELLDGRSLHDIIKDEAPLATARIADLIRQTLAALAAAHDIGILHRDLKPENIIVVRKRADDGVEREIVKVCDFGIAKLGTGSSSATPGGSKLTTAGAIVGTPDYMSPEQARGASDVDGRTDLYSVGVMMYEMMTRKLPFAAETPLGVVLMHLNDVPKPPSEHANVDPRLEAIVLKAMAKKPEDRFASAREMRQALTLPEGDLFLPPAAPSSKRKLVLAPEESVVHQTATAMAAPKQRLPMRSLPSAKEMLDTPAVPKQNLTLLWVALGALAVGGIGYWFATRPAPTPARPIATTPTASVAVKPTVSAPIAIVSASAPVVHPSASASASVKVATSASIRPTSSTPPPIASIVPSTTASAPAPLPPSPFKVILGTVLGDKVNPTSVTNVLPLDKFQRCYRDGVGQAKPPTGSAKLHITMTNTQTEATFAGPPELASIGTCIVNAANKISVDLPEGKGTADIDLNFKAE